MAGLLVSVRSAEEARLAVEGGATVIDVKEPDFGPLGRAGLATWQAVRAAVPPEIAVSVAMGELRDWSGPTHPPAGIAFRKLGLSRSGSDWAARWAEVRRLEGPGPRWVAVAYADWEGAEGPDPDAVLDAALQVPECSGVLVDTWDKSRPALIEANPRWLAWIARARASGRFVALAGGLDLTSIGRLAPLDPDLFAVRGAACDHNDRLGVVRADRVARLVRLARGSGPVVLFPRSLP